MKILQIVLTIILLLFVTKIFFSNLVLFEVLYPEYFQDVSVKTSIYISAFILLNVIYVIFVTAFSLLHWAKTKYLTPRKNIIVILLLFIALQVDYFLTKEISFGEYLPVELLEILDSIWMYLIVVIIGCVLLYLVQSYEKKRVKE